MELSRYVADILDLLLDDEEVNAVAASRQISFITGVTTTYDPGGMYVDFTFSEEALKYLTEKPDNNFNGVKIKAAGIEAEAMLFTRNGLITFLEVWCYDGGYPARDLENYILTQEWKENGRKILR